MSIVVTTYFDLGNWGKIDNELLFKLPKLHLRHR